MPNNFQLGGWTANSIAPQLSRGVMNASAVASPAAAASSVPYGSVLSQILGSYYSSQANQTSPIVPTSSSQDNMNNADATLAVEKAQAVHDWGTLGGSGDNTGVSNLLSSLSNWGGQYTAGAGASYTPTGPAASIGFGNLNADSYGQIQEQQNRINALSAMILGGQGATWSAPAMVAAAAAGSPTYSNAPAKQQQPTSGWLTKSIWG